MENEIAQINYLIDAGNYLQAEHRINKILSLDSNQPDALHSLGVIYLKQEKYLEAERKIKLALKYARAINDKKYSIADVIALYFAHYGKVKEMIGEYSLAAVYYKISYKHRENLTVADWYKNTTEKAIRKSEEIDLRVLKYDKKIYKI